MWRAETWITVPTPIISIGSLLDLYDYEGGSDALRVRSPSGSVHSEYGDDSSNGDPSDDPSSHLVTFSINRLPRPGSERAT